MNLSRRKFASLLGIAPIAAPLAAKAAADASVAKLAGVTIEGAAPSIALCANSFGQIGGPTDEYNRAQQAAGDYARLFGLPDFVKENIRRNASYVNILDPDIACKRSWSMSVKIATQRQRNYERYIEQMHHNAWHAKARAGFKTLAGFDWPW